MVSKLQMGENACTDVFCSLSFALNLHKRLTLRTTNNLERP